MTAYLREAPKLSKQYAIRRANEHVRKLFGEGLGWRKFYEYSPLILGLPTLTPQQMAREYAEIYSGVAVSLGRRDLTRGYLRAYAARLGARLTEDLWLTLSSVAMHAAYTLVARKHLRREGLLKWSEEVGREWLEVTRLLTRVWMDEIAQELIKTDP
jgi:hypothetical protein